VTPRCHPTPSSTTWAGGGPRSVLDAGAADVFHVFVAPMLVGGTGPAPVGGTGVARIADALRLAEFTSHPSGEDVYLHGFAPGSLGG
jgi:diaminohydroxyphosphoribosylaminopyrimidine deaminase/5-amino-6-(5-phosphoribosylamino)uracil reductase